MADPALIAPTTLAAVSAAAAWRSSFIAREAAIRSSLAFVWPVVRVSYERDRAIVRVRLHNDGPGLAQDVVAARIEPSGEGTRGQSSIARLSYVRCAPRKLSLRRNEKR
jgi:hypothetical protein